MNFTSSSCLATLVTSLKFGRAHSFAWSEGIQVQFVVFIVEETPRNGLSNSLSSPGATSNQFKKELESTNGTLLPTQIPSGTSSIVNLEESAAGDKEVRSDFVYRFFNPGAPC